MLGDALRRHIRAYIKEHPVIGDKAEPKPRPGADAQSSEHDGDGDKGKGDAEHRARKRRRGGRRAGRRATPDEGRSDDDGSTDEPMRGSAEEVERQGALRLMYEVAGCRDASRLAEITARIRELRDVEGGRPAAEPETVPYAPHGGDAG